MDTFSQALLSEKTHKIPDEYDWFAPLLGDWDCDYDDNYDVCYTCDHCMIRLRFTKEGDRLVGKVLDIPDAYWFFSEITDTSFKWENVMIKPDGTRILDCEIHGKRIKHVSL